MEYKLRDYQQQASDAAVDFLTDKSKNYNAIIVAATGAGKSIIIADIAYKLNSDVLVLCPTKEILTQNYLKMKTYNIPCSMYSASVNKKEISMVTFATIGSIINCAELFSHFNYIIIDECHYVSPKKGMYKTFLKGLKKKVIGFTATPYRLETDVKYDFKNKRFLGATSYLKMLTDYNKPIFKEIIFNIGVWELQSEGHLSKLSYYSIPPNGWDNRGLKMNSSKTDYTDESIFNLQNKVAFNDHLINVINRLLNPKSGEQRNGILIFTRFIRDAQMIADNIPNSAYIDGTMTKSKREGILSSFEKGDIKVLANANVLIVGYDRPDLDTILLAAPTLSLARYYQEIGRALRPHNSKVGSWIVDLCGNIERFGKVEDLELIDEGNGKWIVKNRDKQLTNIAFN